MSRGIEGSSCLEMQLMLRFQERVAYPGGEPISLTPTSLLRSKGSPFKKGLLFFEVSELVSTRSPALGGTKWCDFSGLVQHLCFCASARSPRFNANRVPPRSGPVCAWVREGVKFLRGEVDSSPRGGSIEKNANFGCIINFFLVK